MSFSPVHASEIITRQYKRYLSTIFSLNDFSYQKQFQEQLQNPSTFAKGPFLDVNDSFVTASSPAELIEKGDLPSSFKKLGFRHDRTLYYHQLKAIETAAAGHSMVVSTGTGSGKTESFLMPIFAELTREYEAGTLTDGVRALLIYPMNALANDQVERLRELLKDFPEISFGCYTGQTKEKQRDALEEYRKLNHFQEPIASELISREEMRAHPPHILITNYAMLEYLMVRPGDNVFFQTDTWKFIVLDEAHVYRGSTGIEVSMLLRRLQAALRAPKLQYILTSATLGGEDENEDVARFASELCNAPFSASHVIRASRVTVEVPAEVLELPLDLYRNVRNMLDQGMGDSEINRCILSSYPELGLNRQKPLFDAVRRDGRYWRMRKALKEPQSLQALSHSLKMSMEEIEDFVAVASHCEAEGIRLFDARYHMFLRATESVFITLAPSKRLFLTRRESYTEFDGKTYAVFEISTCSSCHAIYLKGSRNDEHRLVQQTDNAKQRLYYLGKTISDTDEDTQLEDANVGKPYKLCARCGHMRNATSKGDVFCEHGSEYEVDVVEMPARSKQNLKKCAACEAVNSRGILRSFFTGQEAVTSVIATSLFNTLPAASIEINNEKVEDEFGFGLNESVTTEVSRRKARQFLCFSDSRQASAYFASYMDISYTNLLYKRLISQCLSTCNREINLAAFADELSALFLEHDILQDSHKKPAKESWKALLAEMGEMRQPNSLYSMGLLAIGIEATRVSGNSGLNLSQHELAALLNVLIFSMLNDVAVKYPIAMTEEDIQFFSYTMQSKGYQLSGSDSKKNIVGFIPSKDKLSNRRFDYLKRVMQKKRPDFDEAKLRKLLESLWNLLEQRLQVIVRTADSWKIDPGSLTVLKPEQWYRCDKCHRITPFHIEGVCPNYKCDGTLIPCEPKEEMSENHYYRLYHDLDLIPLRIREHTAQLDRNTAYQYQQAFKDKQIDVLSCSTTFEMGVDVGSLETVFMRNMPPLPSNYAQRAGRAGRSKLSAAFALTFCNCSSHDFSYFQRPVDMIHGQIHAPHFSVLNEKIAIRHLYASALSFFWRHYPQLFSTVKLMAQKSPERKGEMDGVIKLRAYLESKPEELRQFIRAFLPEELYRRFGCDDFAWVKQLMADEASYHGKLTLAMEEYDYELDLLMRARQEAFDKRRSTAYFDARINNYERESILSFFSRHNIMPQYGFPIDTVSMCVASPKSGVSFGVELQRDLAMAIAEYAPGSQVVANGQLFIGRYIKRLPNVNWKRYDYINCDECGTLNIEVNTGEGENERLEKCRVCSAALDSSAQHTFIVPAFGFEADPNDIRKPGLTRPERTYRGEVSYVGYRSDATIKRMHIGSASIAMQFCSQDEMAVLNRSEFFVCEYCGYAEVNPTFRRYEKKEHRTSSGYKCFNQNLHSYSLGYRFETDVLQLRFLDPALMIKEYDKALSLLHGILRGVVSALELEDQDISGCLQGFYLPEAQSYCYGLVLYDTTPGGAGHVKRLMDSNVLMKALRMALEHVERCGCGGEEGTASCYACLRSYGNQKVHDLLKRSYVIQFLRGIGIN